MKQLGVCSVLIACCLAAPARAVRFGEKEPADGAAPVTQPTGQVQVVPEEAYSPWQVYGYGSPYDQSAIAGYNGWPQVCSDGLWDNFCNEQHCHCYKGPHQHGGHCGYRNQFGGCNSCGMAGYGGGRQYFHRKEIVPVNSVRGNCANGECAPPADAPLLEMQPMPGPALPPQAVPEPPSEEQASARLLPRSNPVRQPLIPANWRGAK